MAAACLSVALPVQALTLGRASVQSNLGELLRAEVEFENLNADEAESLRAFVASAETYRQSGVELNPALSGARVVLQRIAGRRPALRITTDRAVQEPFLDLILELQWRGGRLVRSYTLLVDLPPTVRGPANPAAIVAVPSLGAPPPLPAAGAFPSGLAPAPAAPTRSAAAPAPRRGPPPPGAPPAPAAVPEPYRVRQGDTLSEVAQRGPRPAGVSLDRLVAALYRENPDAFLDGNIHRLRHGVVLSAPSAQAIAAISDAEARRVIRAQSADFNRYRSQLAARPSERQASNDGRRASGGVDAAVEDTRQPAGGTPDRLRLTKPTAGPASDAAALSRERERQDSAQRVAELSRNVQDLGRLSGAIATASAPAGSGTPAATGGSAAGPAQPGLPASAVVPPPASAPAASAPAAPVASAPASAVRPRPPQPAPPPPEPGLMDTLLEDNLPAVGLAAALVVLVIAAVAMRLLRRRRKAPPETSFLDSHLKPDSFFGASGGQRVDTREASSVAPTGGASTSSMMNYSLSQLDAIGDVDPVAEADVYLAYGRDLQAEEILKEALRTTPERLAIRSKLLEVYAKRRDVKGFEQLALAFHAITGGAGEDWEKVREMGRQLDPDNPLYGGAGAPPMPAGPVHDPMADTPTMPQSILPREEVALSQGPASRMDLDLDLDLGLEDLGSQPTIPLDTDATVMAPAPAPRPPAPATPPAPAAPAAPASYLPPAEDMLNFVTPTGFGPLAAEPPAPTPAPARPPAEPAGPPSTSFGPSTFSLDLDLQEPSALSAAPSMLPPVEGYGASLPGELALDDADPLVRKLELADEFRQIGDLEGARDLLEEVVAGADGALKAKAEAMLANLS
ncbi:FimV/HubP family polar landmark protein [Piscinibacter sakaiensis]|uniref:FimV N-terminal domain-containing protein n=1 Tax=Piscinibacter sakaiensis TaxID=1547922 RepID=A0A0K8P1S6_PISS1|nr:FimV/HubP family polar landmark protein [Piscinibacter sakaiensis]GAP36573.1 hypothetical protein ISF6_2413 [Piscinibacter sakaiensis]